MPWTGPPPAPRHSPARGGTLQGGWRARRTTLLATGLVAGAVLTGCASSADVREAAATGTPSPSAEAATATPSGADLAAGLLPAEAFGADARVVPVSGEQLSRSAPAGMGSPADVEAWRRYADDPVHLQVIADHVKPILAARSAVQYEV